MITKAAHLHKQACMERILTDLHAYQDITIIKKENCYYHYLIAQTGDYIVSLHLSHLYPVQDPGYPSNVVFTLYHKTGDKKLQCSYPLPYEGPQSIFDALKNDVQHIPGALPQPILL